MFFILHLQPVICRSIHTEGRFLATVLLCDGARKKDMVAEGRGGGGAEGWKRKAPKQIWKAGGRDKREITGPFSPPNPDPNSLTVKKIPLYHPLLDFS